MGKTTTIWEFAQEMAKKLGKEFVDYDDTEADRILENPDRFFVFHDLPLVGVEPIDLTGQPKLHNGRVRYHPLEWAYVMSKCPGVLFLDDFLDTQRMDVMSAAYRIFLQRRVGYLYLHPGVQVVAASNTPEFSTLSQMMPAPLANRPIIIRVSPPTPEEWADWMDSNYGDEWDRRVFAFLKRFEREGYLFRPPKEAETLEQHPTPRSWTKLATLLKKGIVSSREEMAGVIGEEMATMFGAFLRVRIDLEELKRNPEKFRILSLDGKYMAVIMLASQDFEEYRKVIEEVMSDSREWIVLLATSLRGKKREKFLNFLAVHYPDFLELLEKVVLEKQKLLEG
ncbi:MAG: hypothetical protein QW098_01130 [Candidatus Hadarchaeales archaeon]